MTSNLQGLHRSGLTLHGCGLHEAYRLRLQKAAVPALYLQAWPAQANAKVEVVCYQLFEGTATAHSDWRQQVARGRWRVHVTWRQHEAGRE